MEAHDLVALAAVALLAASHLVAPMLTFVEFVPRSWMLSAAGGVSVAYVFVHLLPEVADAQAAVDEATSAGLVGDLERHAYIAALIGLLVFYGLERAAVVSQHQQRPAHERAVGEPTSPGVFWIATVSFGFYNGIIGYLLVGRAERGSLSELALFAAALGLHFVVNDLGLRHRHERRYDRFGRPLLVTAIAAGAVVGLLVEVSEAALGVVVAFLAGGIILNVMKEEVPKERESRFLPFAAGTAGYAVLLLLV